MFVQFRGNFLIVELVNCKGLTVSSAKNSNSFFQVIDIRASLVKIELL